MVWRLKRTKALRKLKQRRLKEKKLLQTKHKRQELFVPIPFSPDRIISTGEIKAPTLQDIERANALFCNPNFKPFNPYDPYEGWDPTIGKDGRVMWSIPLPNGDSMSMKWKVPQLS